MKIITRIILSCFIFVSVLGNFSYAFAEELESETFMNKKVPEYKYLFSSEYEIFHYKKLKNAGDKYVIKKEFKLINNTLGLLGFGYLFTCTNTIIIVPLMTDSLDPLSYNTIGLIGGIVCEIYFLSKLFRKSSPSEYLSSNKSKKTDSSGKTLSDSATHIILSGCSGLYIAGIINLFNNNSNTVIETDVIGFGLGAIFGLITLAVAFENLEKMDLDTVSRLQLYPGMLMADENKPIMTMNLAYRF